MSPPFGLNPVVWTVLEIAIAIAILRWLGGQLKKLSLTGAAILAALFVIFFIPGGIHLIMRFLTVTLPQAVQWVWAHAQSAAGQVSGPLGHPAGPLAAPPPVGPKP
ncbi:MAG: hypothetical protein QJR08_00515 [Bacillota bacterium]|nr:hypothetical protein [Bacillota bacterium]